MTLYFDIQCFDDLDPFGRDADPLETLAQDIFHLVVTNKFTLLQDPDWGFGLEDYLSKPLPQTLAFDIESLIKRTFDQVTDAKCTISKVAGQVDTYRFDLKVEVEGTFLDMALQLSPRGIERLSS